MSWRRRTPGYIRAVLSSSRSAAKIEKAKRSVGHLPMDITRRFVRTLVVEDDVVLRRALVRTVERWSDQVRVAGTVRHASRLLQSPLDLAIVDLRLRDGDGKRVLRRAVAVNPRPVILVISGKADPAETFELAKLGIDRFLAKPFSPASLERSVRDAVLEREMRPSDPQGARTLPASSHVSLERELDLVAGQYGLRQRQRELLRLLVSGVPRGVLAKRLGISENTCKTRVRRLLARCGAPRLSELVARIVLNATASAEYSPDGHP